MLKVWMILAATIAVGLSGCGYNALQTNDEQIKASWSEVGTIQATPELANDPAAFKDFQAAQGDLSQALSCLLKPKANFTVVNAEVIAKPPNVDFAHAIAKPQG